MRASCYVSQQAERGHDNVTGAVVRPERVARAWTAQFIFNLIFVCLDTESLPTSSN